MNSGILRTESNPHHEDGLPGDKGNGFRMGHTYGKGRTLTFRIPRDRYGNFSSGWILAAYSNYLLGAVIHKNHLINLLSDIFFEPEWQMAATLSVGGPILHYPRTITPYIGCIRFSESPS